VFIQRHARPFWRLNLTPRRGSIRLIDFIPLSDERRDVIRIVESLNGHVMVRMELTARFDYGSIVPWVRRANEDAAAYCGAEHA